MRTRATDRWRATAFAAGEEFPATVRIKTDVFPVGVADRPPPLPMSLPIPDRLRAFYAENQDQLYTYAVAITRHREAAEDAIHQAFQRLLQRDSLPPDLRPYLFRCVRNAALDTWRRDRGHTDSVFDDNLTPPDSGNGTTCPALTPAEAERWLASLSPDEREAIVLKIYDDFSFQEIADLRGVALSTASSWYRRGLAKLKTLWIKETT